jgi:aspartate/methionine/tyrosine aminotransferase
MNQYAPSHGIPRLRRAIAADWLHRYGRDIDADHEVTITTGATEAIFVAMLAFLDPGDEIIFFEPFYDAYVADAAMAGAVPRVVRLHPPDWHFDPDELQTAFTSRSRAFLLNTPHNPTGKVFTREELEKIASLCVEHDLLVITDEVYDRIVYDQHEHVPIVDDAGHVGTDAHDQLDRQDFFDDRLEDWIHGRAGRA